MSDRVIILASGLAIMAISVVAAAILFDLLTMMMDPSLRGIDYWREVVRRSSTNPCLGTALGACGAVFVLGLFILSQGIMGIRGKGDPQRCSSNEMV